MTDLTRIELDRKPELPRHAEFGWGAPPFGEQFPSLRTEDAVHFDKDNEAIIRLHIRGALTSSERDRAIRRVTKQIRRKLVNG